MSRAKMVLSGALQEGAAEQTDTNWISVKDRLPARCEKVLACGMPNWPTDKRVCFDMIGEYGHWVSGWKITHWMPIPQLPEEYRKE